MTVPSNLVPTPISQLPTVPNVPTVYDQVMIVQNGNTYRASVGQFVNIVTVPSNRLISTGNGIIGGGPLSSDLTLSLENTGVVPGTYGGVGVAPIITVNAQGRLTSVSTSAISVAFNDIVGKPTTLAGYGITDAQPLNSNLSALAAVGTTGLLAQTAFGAIATRSITAGTGLAVTNGDGTSGNPTVSLSNTTVAPGPYGSATKIPSLTINQQGQVTIASEVDTEVDWTNVLNTPTTLAGYGITDAVPDTRTVTGINSVFGGGALSSNLQLSLVNDSTTPGSSKYYGTDGTGTKGWYSYTSGGTVSSVGLTMPAEFSVAGSPITSSGSFTVTLANQSANKVLAGPTSGSAATPAFRSLVAADFPNTTVSPGSYGTSSSVGSFFVDAQGRLTSAANVAISFNAISPITSTGDLIVGNGANSATRLAIGTNGYVLTSNGTTASWQPSASSGVSTISFGSTGLTPSTATNGAVTVAGTLAIGSGGTGQTTASAAFNALSPITSTGDLIIGTGVNTASRLSIGTNGYVLTSNGTTASWQPSTASGSTTTRTTFTATAGQTSFTVTYDPLGVIVVTRNGSVLTPITDYTATSGTAIVLTDAAFSGDNIVVLAINPATSASGVTAFSAGTTGLTPSTSSTGSVTLAGTLAIANGGTGQTTASAALNALGGVSTGKAIAMAIVFGG